MKNNPFRVVIFFVALSLVGVSLIPKLAVNLNPSYNLPSLQVRFSLPESSPQVVERLATAPLENAFSQVSELKEITSVSHYHRGRITLAFEKSADINFKRFEVATLVRQVYPTLPATLSYPTITEASGSKKSDQSPFLVYTVRAPLTAHQIKQTIEDQIAPHLASLAGIEAVNTYGAEEQQITLEVEAEKLTNLRLSFADLTTSLRSVAQARDLGVHTTATGQVLTVKTTNQLPSLQRLENLLIRSASGTMIKVKDIGRVYLEEQKAQRLFRINGQNFVRISLQAYPGSNQLALAQQVKQHITQAQKRLPQGYQIALEYDETEYLQQELDKIYVRSGLSVLILLLFVLLIQRNIRYLAVLFSGILINLCLTIIVAYLLRIDIHLYTIAGITISFGLIVDNAIVMLDHLHRKGSTRVFLALLAASLTTVAALSIVFFLPEEDQQNLIEFSIIIAANLLVSLLVALWYTPAAYQLLFNTPSRNKAVRSFRRQRQSVFYYRIYFRFIRFLARYRGWVVAVIVLSFGLPVFLLPAQWEGKQWYHQAYNETIGTDAYQEDIRLYVDKSLGGTVRLFVRDVFERSGYREPEETKLYVNAELPFGHTLDQMNTIINRVESYLQTVKGIKQFVTQVHSGQNAQVVITFEEEHQQGSLPYQLKSQLIAQSLDWGGVEWDVYGVGEGFSNSTGESLPSFQIEMQGYNYGELEQQAVVLQQKLLGHKRIQEVDINARLSYDEESSQEYVLTFDPQAMGLLSTNQNSLTNKLKEVSEPMAPTLYINYQNQYTPVYLKTSNADAYSRYQLENSPLKLESGKTLPLGDLSTLALTQTTNAIHKKNRQYIRMVGFDYFGSAKFGGEYLDDVLKEMKQVLPIGYEAKRIAWNWNSDRTKRQYGLLVILIIGIYFICSILLENLKQPLFIIATYPISLIGLFLTFSLFDFYFDQGGYAAFILLGGLVVNAAIFIVNDLNNYPKQSRQQYNRSVIKAICGKATPILLTLFSTCFGLIPFLIEGQNEVFWFSLAVGTIGGLLFSLIAVFICLPVFCMTKKKSQLFR